MRLETVGLGTEINILQEEGNHFFCIGKNARDVITRWYLTQQGNTCRQKRFLEEVGKALDYIDYDYKIATLEPSLDANGRLYYKEGEKVCTILSCFEWEEVIRNFSSSCKTEIATLYELFLWYALRIAKGWLTLEFVCDDSSEKGNYLNSPNSSHKFEISGAREVGGARDGVGNSYKLVKHGANFVWCGGAYSHLGYQFPMATNGYYNPNCVSGFGTAVMTLK